MITVQNIDLYVKGHNKTQTTPPKKMESNADAEYKHTTEMIQNNMPTSIIVKRYALKMVPRQIWNAEFPKHSTQLTTPVNTIIISHTATQNCNTSAACEKLIKSIQRYHMEDRQWFDIGYNFIVGGDGKVYEGRGWTSVGSHTFRYNQRSLGVALTGDFQNKIPYIGQIEACKELIKTGVTLGYVENNYTLFGASQLIPTLSPGKALLDEMKTWPHFSTTL